MKRNSIINALILLLLILGELFQHSCKKIEKEMMVSTGEVSDILTTSAEASGLVIDLGEGSTQHGHCFAKTPNVTIEDSKTELGVPTSTGGFTERVVNLQAGSKYYIRAYLSNEKETVYGKEKSFSTGPCVSFEVIHTAGNVAPVTKTVTYGVVETDLSGENKCWITQNLGADNQASSATDVNEMAAGWYWQFNRKQGYKYESNLTPSTAWISSIDENSNWTSSTDPCSILLGPGWRIPTQSEWGFSSTNGGWSNRDNAYTSLLKLHAAGGLTSDNGSLYNRGSVGFYWSSTQQSNSDGSYLIINSLTCGTYSYNKVIGFSVRCLKD
jgi:hypothetical protein